MNECTLLLTPVFYLEFFSKRKTFSKMFSLTKMRFKYKGYRNFYKYLQTKAKQQQYNNNQMICEGLPVFMNAKNYTDKIALRDSVGSYTYANLFISAKELSKLITVQLQGKPSQRVVFLCPNNANYVITQWAIWMSGQIGMLSALYLLPIISIL